MHGVSNNMLKNVVKGISQLIGCFYKKSRKKSNCRYFEGVFNKTIISLALACWI